ncbi:Vacuolar protein sorting-associated protein 29 [Rhizophlyctis rosea]|uniref:Vacuolar protein sorting-associated protein 29 n=1 Tax=Rhizophlyctis rosea TaxID=64517 RepID=A0AAD5X2H6_9FUNG|nr:Vacuolar protein sorting-associated protein 29 [Rhizophlyctis rosea]
MLVLVLGDFHIPHRAIDLPPKFKKLLVPGKIQQILCTGNLCSRALLDYLRTVCSDLVLVRGDMDESSAALPSSISPSRVITHGPLRIGITHGHQILPWGDAKALGIVARQMDVDVLISGHTHQFEAFESDGRFFVNPGSATGAFSTVPPGNGVASAVPGGGTGGEGEAGKAVAGTETTPSFVLMDVQGPNVVMYVYQLINGDVKVEKLDYTKKLYD